MIDHHIALHLHGILDRRQWSDILLITLGFWTLVFWRVGNAYNGFREYRRRAVKTGFPVVETPLAPIGLSNILTLKFIIPILERLPITQHWKWLSIANHRNSFLNLRSTYEIHAQFTARKNDFVKPVKNYRVMDVFGRNILTTEGEEWRRHKRIVGKSFGERSMGLVWEESLRQAEGMVGVWGRRMRKIRNEGGRKSLEDEELRVDDAGSDTAILSLHVICAAGFGVPQLWEGQENEEVGKGTGREEGNGAPDLGLNRPIGNHTLGFKDCLNFVLSGLLLIFLWPQWALKFSPIKRHGEVYKAFKETTQYVTELLEHKKKQMAAEEHDRDTMDLMGKARSPASNCESKHSDAPLTESEIKSNAFIFLLAGHETTASSIHLCFVYLAMSLASQSSMQNDIDAIVGSKCPSAWTYMNDFSRLYNSMVGAVLNEELRLMPIADTIPKVTAGEQRVTVDGKEMLVPDGTFIHLNTVGTNRNPRYWPHEKLEGGRTDLDNFVPERWLLSKTGETHHDLKGKGENVMDAEGEESSSEETATLFKPVKGAFISFSEGPRSCPGRKFAQVEITAVLAVIFQKYSVELDVCRWASDEDVNRMNSEERKELYGMAIRETNEVLRRCNQAQIVLKMAKEDKVPLRFVERGRERFAELRGVRVGG
ncbi:hypothetical protein EYC84_007014 [Monilinia fructicola]|uniref:Cytochrome P450 n=1 Tax=Monilinia fructicola TaxID=38448 RepID=A0A5M9K7Z1_MONFR|nr:hypothetical protein EYC84_007014 [Monilinia fructicola]